MSPIATGQKLFDWICTRYQPGGRSATWIDEISREFEMEGLESLLLRSTALMLVRRLISNAAWYEQRYPGDRIMLIDIFERDYLQGYLGFYKQDRRELSKLTFASLEASKRDVSPSLKQKLFNEAANRGKRCKLCGETITYDLVSEDPLSFSLDHIWPHSLGGESEEWNLQVTHRRCNSKRLDMANFSDAHYEHYHVKSNWSSDNQDSYWTELNWQYRIASMMKAGFVCEVCKDPKPIDILSESLNFSQRNQEENLNIFNVQVTCNRHKRLPGMEG